MNTEKLRPTVLVPLVATAALLGAPATAAAPGDPTGGWKEVPTDPFTSPAGDLCSFALRSQATFDHVYGRTTRTFADGKPRREEYSGPLVVRLTNERTGATTQRDLSGRAVLTHRRDGGYDFASHGPVAIGFHVGDGLPRGYYVLRGHHVVRFAADGTRTVVVDQGREENVCHALRRKTR